MTDQLTLFATPPRKTAGELRRESLHERSRSPELLERLLAVYRKHPGEFIDHGRDPDIRAIREEVDLGSYFYGAIHRLHYDGLLEEKRIYFGAESPCEKAPTKRGNGKQAELVKPYLGYTSVFRLKEQA